MSGARSCPFICKVVHAFGKSNAHRLVPTVIFIMFYFKDDVDEDIADFGSVNFGSAD